MSVTRKIFAQDRAKLNANNSQDYKEIFEALNQSDEINRIIAQLQAKKDILIPRDVFNELVSEVFGSSAAKGLEKINFLSFMTQKESKFIKDLKIRESMHKISAAAQESKNRLLAQKNKSKSDLRTHIVDDILDKLPTPEGAQEKFKRLQQAIEDIVKFNEARDSKKEDKIDITEMLQECYDNAKFSLSVEEFNFIKENLVKNGQDAMVKGLVQKRELRKPTLSQADTKSVTKQNLSQRPKIYDLHLFTNKKPTEDAKPKLDPESVPNPFKDKNIGQYVAEFLGTSSKELTSEQNAKLHEMMVAANVSQSSMERQKFIDIAVAAHIRKMDKSVRASELQKYIEAKTGTKENPIKLRNSMYFGLLSNEAQKLKIAKDLSQALQTPSSATEEFILIRKAMLANKKATGPQFGKGKLELILTKMSKEVLNTIEDPREKAVTELRAYLLTIEAEKQGRFFNIGRTNLNAKKTIANEVLDLLIHKEQVGETITWELHPEENISLKQLRGQIIKNSKVTHHTPGKGEGRLNEILTNLYASLGPKSKHTKK